MTPINLYLAGNMPDCIWLKCYVPDGVTECSSYWNWSFLTNHYCVLVPVCAFETEGESIARIVSRPASRLLSNTNVYN